MLQGALQAKKFLIASITQTLKPKKFLMSKKSLQFLDIQYKFYEPGYTGPSQN